MQLKFKTNIKCQGCINNVTPVLNNISEITKWEVELTHPDRILTVEGEALNFQKIKDELKAIGYNVFSIDNEQ